MGEYNPKSKRGLPVSWRGIERKLPKTLSTFQIVILAGFLSLLILRSTIGMGNFSSQFTAPADEYLVDEQSRPSDSKATLDFEPKRTLVQTEDSEPIEKALKTVQQNALEEFEEEIDAQISEQHLAEVRAATGKDVKNVKEELSKPIEKAVEEMIEKDKAVSRPKEAEVVENFQQVEAQLGEEETADELADFEKFENGEVEEEKVSSTKPKAVVEIKKEQIQPTVVPKATKENSVEKKAAEKLTSAEEKADEIEQKVTSKKENPVQETKSEEHKFVEGKYDKPHTEEEKVEVSTIVEEEEVVDSVPENVTPLEMTPEQVEEFTKEAIVNMSKFTRRDHPDAFTLGPKISDWDEQRASWLEKNPDKKSTDPHKPKVLLLTGSQPWPCNSPVGDHYLLKMIKNKVDYARIHKMEIFYSFAHLNKPMSHFWAKLPLIRKMMLMRPEVEWIFWMDSDAMFTDMVFEIPFEKYQDASFVMWGWEDGLWNKRSWVACNTGVMFLRNNQWNLDLLEAWSHMGPEGEIRNEAGKIMSSYLTGRGEMMADDQSALVFLMLTTPELRPKFYLEDEYFLSGYWVDLVGKYEEFLKKSRPGAGGRNWPFTTHFTGCQPCSGKNNQLYEGNSCLDGMEKAFNFADNQVLRPFGFEHESLFGAKVTRIRNETTKPVWSVPVNNPWAVQSFYD